MAMRTSLAALAMLLPSFSGGSACDDYPEEMAIAAARRDVTPAQLPAAQVRTATQVALPTTDTSVVEPTANADLAGALPMTLR